MVDKVTLASIASFQNDTTAVVQYNANNTAITAAIDNTLSRDGTQPNQMGSALDMNSNQILNLPSPVNLNSPLRLQDLNTFIGGGAIQTIPAGGSTGDVLAKNSGTSYDVNWSSNPSNIVAGTNITTSGTNPTTVATSLTPIFNTVQTPALTVTSSITATNLVTNASLAQMGAFTFKGNNTNATANASDIPIASVQSVLGVGSLLIQAVNVNFNSANTDTSIPISLPTSFTTYQIRELHISNASASISTATFGLFSASGGNGPIIPAGTAITVTSSSANTNNNYMIVVPTNLNSECYNFSTLFFRVGTAQGSAALATVTLLIYPLF